MKLLQKLTRSIMRPALPFTHEHHDGKDKGAYSVPLTEDYWLAIKAEIGLALYISRDECPKIYCTFCYQQKCIQVWYWWSIARSVTEGRTTRKNPRKLCCIVNIYFRVVPVDIAERLNVELTSVNRSAI